MRAPELSPRRLEAGGPDGWVLAVPLRPAATGAAARAVEDDGLYASDGACGVVFDGFLHDRRNGGPSDPRLVLEAYRREGEGVVSRLSGRFALVLWDAERGLVLCARDPLGIHPLFYAEVGDELRLSSSFGALRSSPGVSSELNRVVVAEQACLRWHDPEETLLRAIRRVPPGHVLKFRGAQRTLGRYWDPSPTGPDDWVTEDQLGQFEERFARAIDRCLVHGRAGIYLSGGLDSVSVAAVARDRSREAGLPPPRALSLRFPHPDCNEEEIQREVAERLGLPQMLVGLEEAAGRGGVVSAALELGRTWPAPLLNYWLPAYQHLGREAERQGCGAILTGTGGDEWLCVSPYYAADLLRSGDLLGVYRLWANLSRSNPVPRLLLLRNIAWRFGARDLLSAAAAAGLGTTAPALLRRHRERSIARATPAWAAPDPQIRREMDERALRYRPKPTTKNLYQRELEEALDHPLMNIEVEETYEAGRRLGVRVLQPFWDPDLIRFLVRVPPELLNRGGRSKGVVRDMLARRFPEVGFDRHKKVVATNYSSSVMLEGGRRAWRELGGATELSRLDVVDAKALESSVMHTFATQDHREVHRLWYVLSLEAWLRGQEHT